jgi:hypothetical protein
MKKFYHIGIFLLLFSLAFGVRVYWLSQKEGLNVDEGLSVILSFYNDYGWRRNYELNRAYTGQEIKQITLVDNASFRNMLGDIYRLWRDNRDSPHTNLYYSFLRVSLAGIITGDIQTIIFRGGILNLIFFSISFFFFFLLMKQFFPSNKLVQYGSTACAFLSTATISNTLLLRPYQIQETMFIIFCFYFFKTFDIKKHVIEGKKAFVNQKTMLILSLVAAFTLLSGYYSVILIALFGLYVLFEKGREKCFYEILFYFLVLGLALAFAQTFYPRYLFGFISSRGLQTVSTVFSSLTENVTVSVRTAFSLLHKHFFTWQFILLSSTCLVYLLLFKVRKQFTIKHKQTIFVFIATLVFSITILILAPFKTLRYIMPVFPFFILLPAVLIDLIRKQKIAVVAMLILFLINFVNILNESKIETLFRNKADRHIFTQNPDIPVFVFQIRGYWMYADFIPYFNDRQIYYFINNFETEVTRNYNELFFIIGRNPENIHFDISHFDVTQEFTLSYFSGKKLNRIIRMSE